MPKVRPLTAELRAKEKAENRWQKQDRNFAEQVGMLLRVSGLSECDIAEKMGMCRQTVSDKLKHPSNLRKREERMLASIFEEYGLNYDFSMGEGGMRNAAVVN